MINAGEAAYEAAAKPQICDRLVTRALARWRDVRLRYSSSFGNSSYSDKVETTSMWHGDRMRRKIVTQLSQQESTWQEDSGVSSAPIK